MNVKIGNSYVSEAAANYANARAAERKEGAGVLAELSEAFPSLRITVGTTPFAGTGTNNVSISPKILREMERDPEKRLEYEALLYDCAETMKSLPPQASDGRRMKARGFIIDGDGGLRGWSVSEGGGRGQGVLPRKDKRTLIEQMIAGRAKAKKRKNAIGFAGKER